MEKPTIIDNPNLEEIKEKIQEYLDYFESDEYHEDVTEDFEYPIFEAVIIAFCGDKAFDWINKKVDENE